MDDGRELENAGYRRKVQFLGLNVTVRQEIRNIIFVVVWKAAKLVDLLVEPMEQFRTRSLRTLPVPARHDQCYALVSCWRPLIAFYMRSKSLWT